MTKKSEAIAKALDRKIKDQAERIKTLLDERTKDKAEIERLREALEDISIYGCGMLNQPAAINGPEEDWLRQRIAEYERRAHKALTSTGGGE